MRQPRPLRRAGAAGLTGLLCLVAGPSAADRLSLDEISAYLNSLQSSRGDFTQIDADGTISTGTVAIKRPGRMRFDYNPPNDALVMAGGGAIAIFDRKMGGRPEQYPLGTTPLKFILQRDVDLAASGVVIGHSYDGTATTVTAQDPEHPEYGSIDLVFTDDPVELRQWIMRTDTGEATVILGEMQTDADLPASLFSIQSEIMRQGG